MTNTELNRLAKNKKVTHVYIIKGVYYRPNCCGYTDYRTRAGVYEKEDAIQQATSCRDLTLIPINFEEHNNEIIDAVKDLLTRYLPSPIKGEQK